MNFRIFLVKVDIFVLFITLCYESLKIYSLFNMETKSTNDV